MGLRNSHLLAGVSAMMLGLSGCGGGGGVGSTPTPPVTPTPTPTPTQTPASYIIANATGAETLASKGGAIRVDASFHPTGGSTADVDQLHIRYNASSNAYEVQLPASTAWQRIGLDPNVPNSGDFVAPGASTTYVQLQESAQSGYRYSALIAWTNPGAGGYGSLAFGIPTPAGAVPLMGNAAYAGTISGRSTETSFDSLAGHAWPATVGGTISLNFDFAGGKLAGSISPTIYNNGWTAIPTLSFTNTIYAPGSTTFSGSFITNLPGTSSFSGQFTGSAAQEAIGNFAFPYPSLENGQVYQAFGAWIAKH